MFQQCLTMFLISFGQLCQHVFNALSEHFVNTPFNTLVESVAQLELIFISKTCLVQTFFGSKTVETTFQLVESVDACLNKHFQHLSFKILGGGRAVAVDSAVLELDS